MEKVAYHAANEMARRENLVFTGNLKRKGVLRELVPSRTYVGIQDVLTTVYWVGEFAFVNPQRKEVVRWRPVCRTTDRLEMGGAADPKKPSVAKWLGW